MRQIWEDGRPLGNNFQKSGFKPAKVVRDGSQPIEKVYSFFV